MFIEDLIIQGFDELPSTQVYAKDLVLNGKIGAGVVISALNQTAGKGRYDRPWIGTKGNIAITLIITATGNDQQVSYVTGLAVADTIKDFCPTITLKLKWVNDVLVEDSKISGILLEKVGKLLLVGIGFNLLHHQKLPELNATSLESLGWKIDHETFLAKLLENFKNRYNAWLQYGFVSVKNSWKEHAHKLGEDIRVSYPNGSSETGIMQDVDDDGNLLLTTPTGIKEIKVAELFYL